MRITALHYCPKDSDRTPTFIPPPSMDRMRTPRPSGPGRPTARPTSSFLPNMASALMAARLTPFLRPSTCSTMLHQGHSALDCASWIS